MAAQQGLAMLLKRGDAASPEVFTTISGGRADTLSLNKGTIDITDKASANRWRVLLGGALKNCNVAHSGIFTDGASEESLRADFFGSTLHNYQVLIPNFGTFTGAFVVTNYEWTGENEDGVTYSCTLDSAGEITFASV